MKWVALAMFLGLIPILTLWLRTGPARAPWAWSLLAFLPFVIAPWHLGIAPFSIPFWSGYVKGYEVTLLDAVAISILLGTRGRWKVPVLLIPLLVYIFACLVAVVQARFPNYAFAYIVQLLRVLILFLAVARIVALEGGQRAILRGLALGLLVQASYAVWERAGGALQTGGGFGHQNLLGFVSHMGLMPAFAMFLSGLWPGLGIVGVLSGITVVILTISRATIAFSAVGLVLTYLISLGIGFSARKAAVGALGAVVLLAAIPFAQANLNKRFAGQEDVFLGEDLERVAFEKAAGSIIADHPMGVGPNHYVFISNTEGYADRAGVFWGHGSRSTSVHNSYLLVQAETGLIGLVAFLTLIFMAIIYAFRTAIRYRGVPGSEMLIGVGCALIAVSLHGLFEWTFVVEPTQYLLAVMFGIIAGLRHRYSNRARMIKPAKPSTVEPSLAAATPLT